MVSGTFKVSTLIARAHARRAHNILQRTLRHAIYFGSHLIYNEFNSFVKSLHLEV